MKLSENYFQLFAIQATSCCFSCLSKRFLYIILFLGIAACSSFSFSQQFTFSYQHLVGDTYMGIRLRGTLELASYEIDGLTVKELSGLAFDEDEDLLYAVSDRGYLFHLRPILANNILTKIDIIRAYPLRDFEGKAITEYPWCDAEGLAIVNERNGIKGDSELIISFEVKPRIIRFRPDGKPLKQETLPPLLQEIKNYAEPNKSLEAVTVHPRFGILTAPEYPLNKEKKSYSVAGQHQHTIYALDGKQQWTFPAYPAPNSAIVALEALTDGSVLVLERAYVSLYKPFITSLRQVQLTTETSFKQLAVFDNSQGWRLDNFEGLTHYKDNYFFIVSDDNNNGFQRTLLSCFELLP